MDTDGTAEVQASVKLESLGMLPEKSRSLYEKTYKEYITWCEEKKEKQHTESALLAYFSDIAARDLIASLWPKYSMLKATLHLKENIDISKFNKLITFIKKQQADYTPKQSRVLEKEQVETFISDAPNSLFLMTKVALIFGVSGAMRKEELLKLEIDDVEDLGSKYLITIRSTKAKTNRMFTVVDNEQNTFLKLIRRYASLRPTHTPHNRFFIYYKNNRCTTQPVGINAFSKLPSRIAAFLKLEHPQLYTGHCLRRSSAAIRSGIGANFTAFKRNGAAENKVNIISKSPAKAHTSSSEAQNSISNFDHDIKIKSEYDATTINYDIEIKSEYDETDDLSTPCFSNCTVTEPNMTIHKHDTD